MNLVDLLNDSKQFNETQNIICQYILNHSEDVVKMSARALAKQMLQRLSGLCKRLDMKIIMILKFILFMI